LLFAKKMNFFNHLSINGLGDLRRQKIVKFRIKRADLCKYRGALYAQPLADIADAICYSKKKGLKTVHFGTHQRNRP
jgi:hypothetical protein